MLPPAYSALPNRAPLSLPHGARVAVYVVMNIEHFTFGKLGTAIQPHLTSPPEIANYGWRDYGNRVGIWRLLELFAELGIPVTAALNAEMVELYPPIIDGIRQYQWSVMAHGWNNSTGHSGMALEAEEELIERSLELLDKVSGARPWGWLTPGFSITENTFALLRAAGIRYTTDWVNDDQPYWLETAAGPLLGIPYTLETNDISLCLSARLPGEAFAQALIDQFDQLWRDGERSPRIMAIGLHPFIVGQPLRMGSLKKALKHIQSHPHTWLTTSDSLYEWYSQACPAPEPV